MAGPTCVDLFSGSGGFSLGFENAGFEVLAATDIHEDALETYRHNFPDTDVYQDDILNIADNIEVFLDSVDVAPCDVDVVIGGPPCKGFSTAGTMNPDDPRNSLIDSYLEVVEQLDPRMVVLENVDGILKLEKGRFANKIKKELKRQGYHVSGPLKVSAAAFGVPQTRTRVFFIGSKSSKSIEFPRTTREVLTDGGEVKDHNQSSIVTAQDALGDLEFLGIGEEAKSYQTPPQSDYQREMRSSTNKLYNHLSTNHGRRVQKRLSMIPVGGSMNDIPEEYQTSKHTQQRLHPEKPAPTITTLPEDIVHYRHPRIPTVREMARLQSFPDWFEFKGPRTTGGPQRKGSCPQYSQVGNAVPPRLAKAIGEKISTYLR